MTRNIILGATVAVVLSAVMLPSGRAEDADPFAAELETPPLAVPSPLEDGEPAQQVRSVVRYSTAIHRTSGEATSPTPMPINPEAYAVPPQSPGHQSGYVRLGAPLYPSPQPNTPIWVGSTVITSPALAPHEMLYPHTYRAIYPPYYHRVRGGWIVTPFGVRSHERWELQGTQVEVKYRSSHPSWIKSGWFPPVSSQMGSRY